MTILKLHDRSDKVRQIQILLNSALKPSPNLKADGDFGHQTERAVKRFQKAKGLTEDGEVGPKTLAALDMRPIGKMPIMQDQPPIKGKGVGKSWLEIAKAEIGIREDALPGKHTQRIIDYHATTTLRATDDETPWCSSFVNWVVEQGGGTGTKSALARSWLDWGRKLDKPQSGCIIVIKKRTPGFTSATGSTTGYHVGFYVSGDEKTVRILGGNQSDQVKYSNFGLAGYEIKGCRLD
ncbi:TIGR02594 family protein [Sphingomonas sp. 1P06PA]|uniref:NlpC/P60 family protein n=1 Tax=Sphingomonas sp. 1P06PA TaxID=554121 RepID=UPI0039A66F74